MRNFLIALMLCVLTLTTSNVFAEGYDESRRTERFGLSFYDGRPLYVFGFGRLPGNSFSAPTRCLVYRVYTGDKLSDYGTIDQGDGRGEQIYENGQYVEMMFYHYVLDDAGEPVILSTSGSFAPGNESQFVSYHLKNLTFTVSGGDLAVETYDNILPNAQDWARRGILLAVALLVISAGSNKFRELTSGETQATVKDAKKSDGAASPKAEKPKPKKKIDTSEYLELEHESPYRLRTPRELREERAQEDREHTERQRVMSEEEALREAYISGDYWGKSFSDEVRASNRELYEAFDKMAPFTRRLLIQKFDEMSFTKEATLLKSYNKDVYGFADDNIGNPFEGDDEEDGEPPF